MGLESAVGPEHPTGGKLRWPPPTPASKQSGGEPAGYGETAIRTTNERIWFKHNFCNGAQACVQAWDWAIGGTDHAVGYGTGIAMVGSEGGAEAAADRTTGQHRHGAVPQGDDVAGLGGREHRAGDRAARAGGRPK